MAVAGPLTYTLHQHHTVGPADFIYTDADGYIAQTDGQLTRSAADATNAWHEAQRGAARFSSLTQYNWAFRAQLPQQFDATALEANVNGIVGLGATDTWDPFLIAILVCGGLGAFAVVRYGTQSATWAAALSGALFGGPFFLDLYFDTYQAAICGVALAIPLTVVALEAFRTKRAADVVLCALVLSGFLNVYPLFVPLVVLAALLVVGWLAFVAFRRREPIRARVRSLVLAAVGIGVLAAVFEPVAFVRDVRYARAILDNTIPLPRVGYRVALDVFPGWLFQTRGFWNMSSPGSSFHELLLGGVIPLAFAAVILIAVRRYRPALALLVLAGVCAVVAEYSFASRQGCTYCAERNLLPLTPIAVVLLGLGVYALWQLPGRWWRWLGPVAALLVVVAVGQRTRVELTRYSHGSYFLDSANRSLLGRVPVDGSPVALEGYDAGISAQSEEALTYFLAVERLDGRVTLPTNANNHGGLGYLTFGNPSGPWPSFNPGYAYVLSRLGGVSTARDVIARSGPIVLARRARPLDVLPFFGLGESFSRLDPRGTAWVQPGEPLIMYVTGYTPASQVWARLTFSVHEPFKLTGQPRVRTRVRGTTLSACVPADGFSPLRVAELTISAAPQLGPYAAESFPPAPPFEGIALTSMRGVAGACRP